MPLALAAQWTTRLADLLEEDPGVEADLRTLVQEIRVALPAGLVAAVIKGLAARHWRLRTGGSRAGYGARS